MSFSLAIVIPAYKAAYFRECLESIAKQTDKRFTLYIGDDCSPNNLQVIVDEFKESIPNLVYHRFEENLGSKDLVAHWKRCIDLTQGEDYIWLFSDDDTMDPSCVQTFHDIPEEVRSKSIVHFDINVINGKSELIKIPPKYPEYLKAGDYLKLKLQGKLISFVIEFIFPRKIYERVNGFQNFDLAWGSDFMTWLKMGLAADNGIYTPSDKCHVNWRMSEVNISPNKSYPIIVRKLNSLIENAAFIKKCIADNPTKFKDAKFSFKYAKHPLGEIYRNRETLTTSDLENLKKKYIEDVGFKLVCSLVFAFISLKRN